MRRRCSASAARAQRSTRRSSTRRSATSVAAGGELDATWQGYSCPAGYTPTNYVFTVSGGTFQAGGGTEASFLIGQFVTLGIPALNALFGAAILYWVAMKVYGAVTKQEVVRFRTSEQVL